MQQCPECWSGFETGLSTCPHCGHVQAQPRSSSHRWLIAVAIAIAAVTAWLLFSRSKTPDHASVPIPINGHDTQASTDTTTVLAEAQKPITPAASPRVHWTVTTEGQSIPILLLTSPAGPTGFLPLKLLPLKGVFELEGNPVQIDIVHYDIINGYALLRLPNIPAGATPLTCATATSNDTSLLAWTSEGEELTGLQIVQHNPEGKLILDRSIPAASALLNPEKEVVAYSLGGVLALPLAPARAWVDRLQTRSLKDVQAELRASDPFLIAEDAASRLTKPLEVQRVREAIALLQTGIHLARDRKLLARYDELQRLAWQNLVRLLAPNDPTSAITEARNALAQFPNHLGLLADTVRIIANQGDPLEAADRYIQLRSLSLDHAKQTADILARALANRGRLLVEENRITEGLAQYARAVELFPNRADLHIAYASALQRAGNTTFALEQARQAAALEPSFRSQLKRFLQTPTGADRVVIPFDPATNVIHANVTVGNIPVRFVVDTGATMTTIPTALADRLNLRSPANRRVTVTTASGKVVGEVVRLPTIKIGKLRLRAVEAVVMNLPNHMEGQGLLGMNALKQTQVQIDTERGRLILRRKRRTR